MGNYKTSDIQTSKSYSNPPYPSWGWEIVGCLNKNVIGTSVQCTCLLHVTCKCSLERTSQEVEGWSLMGVYKMRAS